MYLRIRENKGITLIALIITIILLLILAGIAIATLTGENGLLARTKQAQTKYIKSDMKEKLTLALLDLQTDKVGEATLDDVTQDWANEKIEEYQTTIKEDASISGKKAIMRKDGVVGRFTIDENLNIIESEFDSDLEFMYDIVSKNGDDIEVLITVISTESGINTIELPDGTVENCNGANEKEISYTVKFGQSYKVKITLEDGKEEEGTILVNEYYYTITKDLAEGITIDNTAVKAKYNEPYTATVGTKEDYILQTLEVKMGGETVTAVDVATGTINIEKVTGDIEIKATAKKIEIVTTTPIINTSTTATSSLGANTQPRGTTLYINFKATIEGENCTIEPVAPYAITSNGKYKFTITGTYQNKTITKEIEVTVYQFQSVGGIVQYDAGDWTQEEIEELQSLSLYNINASHTASSAVGLNFTFGGFTYEGDTENASSISSGAVITSRNQSVNPQSGYGTTKYDGWQILETTIDSATGREYITKIVHAGIPENFVYYCQKSSDSYSAEYILSGGMRHTGFNKYNARSWDMYKDQSKLEMIEEVHAMTYDDALAITGSKSSTTGIRNTGGYYWLASASSGTFLFDVRKLGDIGDVKNYCFGVRPVVSLKSGVYIASGDGTESSPYILAME